MSFKSKLCPECQERLSIDADQCGACGWKAPGARKRAGKAPSDAPRFNPRCTWRTAGIDCANPVGLFAEGQTSGFCLLHRKTPGGPDSARIAEASHGMSREEYLQACQDATYGPLDEKTGLRPDSPSVASTRVLMRNRGIGGKPSELFREFEELGKKRHES